MNCVLCPRKCNVDRNIKTGYCGMPKDMYIARAALHMWEEPCISGSRGSGAVFFCGCVLRCVFCQNYTIANQTVKVNESTHSMGVKVSPERLAEIFFELQDKKANNINLVTPTHYVPQIIKAIDIAKKQGFDLPFVYNTGSYENVETIRMLDGLIDVYLPDLKYFKDETAIQYSKASGYFDTASRVIGEMYKQTGKPRFNGVDDNNTSIEDNIMTKGVIVRHLILPEHIREAKNIVEYIYNTYKDNVYLSIMNQYTPLPQVKEIEPLNRKVTTREYKKVVDYAISLGVENAFIQEGGTKSESFIPSFNNEGVI